MEDDLQLGWEWGVRKEVMRVGFLCSYTLCVRPATHPSTHRHPLPLNKIQP